MNAKTYLIAGCIALAGLASCRTTSEVLDRSQHLTEQHNFHQAYWVVANALDENPTDPELWQVFSERRLAYLLDHGQQLVFHERESEAIGEFQKALAYDPDNKVAKRWIARAKRKLAKEALRLAETLHHEGNLQGALKLYNKALAYVPEIEEAVDGIKAVNKRYQDRADQSGVHYVLGSRARGEQKFLQSHYHSGIAVEMDESNEPAKKQLTASGKRLARQLLERARIQESKGFYASAHHDYEKVKADLPDTEGIDVRIASMKNEVDARQLSRDAEMLTLKLDFDGAAKKLEEAFALSKLERATISGQMLDNKHRRYDHRYQKAKDQELEYNYEAALEAFKDIDKAWPSRGFLDVKTRISSLESHIKEANVSWKAGVAAEKAGKLKDAINHFEEALLVYPGFKDLDARLKRLKARAGS